MENVIVINKMKDSVYIPELGKCVPSDGEKYVLPKNIYLKYKFYFNEVKIEEKVKNTNKKPLKGVHIDPSKCEKKRDFVEYNRKYNKYEPKTIYGKINKQKRLKKETKEWNK